MATNTPYHHGIRVNEVNEGINALKIVSTAAIGMVVTASDADGDALTYSLAGGADAAHFTINASTGRRYAEYSPSIAAALNGAIGYEHAADIAQEAANDNRTVRDVAGERTDMPDGRLDQLLDPITLSRRLGQTCREQGGAQA